MRIVVLDGFTLNPGDLSWSELEALGQCEVFDRTPPEFTMERSKDVEVLLTNKTVLDAEIIGKLPRLFALQSELYPGPGSTVPEFDSNPVISIYQLAITLDPQPLDAQRILEAETADDRITVVSQVLDESIELTEMQLNAG